MLGLSLGLTLGRRGAGAASYAGHNMVVFDGTNDYLNRGALATGLGTARYMTLAFKIKPLKAAGTLQNLLHFGAANARIVIDSANKVQVILSSASLGGATAGGVTANAMDTGTEYTVHLALDFQAGSPSVAAFMNGVDVTGDISAPLGPSGTPGSVTWGSLAQTAIAASNAGAFKFEGEMGFFWFTVGDTAASHFITDASKFYDGGDVDLGTDGTGSGLAQPVIFWGGQNAAAHWNAGVNAGSGADTWTMNGSV